MSDTAPALPPPAGLIVELVTPLLADGRLDGEGLASLLARVVPAADAVLAGSPGLGEALDLLPETRRQLLSQALAAVAGRVPLFLGITGHAEEETRQWALAVTEELHRQNYPGMVYLADLPLWYHSNRGLPQCYQRLLAAAPLPLIMVNQPAVISKRAPLFKRRNIRTHVFKKIAAHPGVVGLIYQGDMRRFLNYHYAAAHRPGFAFYETDEAHFLTRPGAWGVLSPGAQLLPVSWQRVARACLHPEETAADHDDRFELWGLSRHLLELARLYGPNPTALLKTALSAQGIISTATTAAGVSPAPASRREELLAFLASLTV